MLVSTVHDARGTHKLFFFFDARHYIFVGSIVELRVFEWRLEFGHHECECDDGACSTSSWRLGLGRAF